MLIVNIIYGQNTSYSNIIPSTYDENYYYAYPEYEFTKEHESIRKGTANALIINSPFRQSLLASSRPGLQHLQKRELSGLPPDPADTKPKGLGLSKSGMFLGGAMSGHSFAEIINTARAGNMTDSEKGDIYLSAGLDIAFTVMAFSGNPVLMAIGGVGMFAKAIFMGIKSKPAPPPIDAEAEFIRMQQYVEARVPSMTKIYESLKPMITQIAIDEDQSKATKDYEVEHKENFKMLADYMDINGDQADHESFYRGLVNLINQRMNEVSLPTSPDEVLDDNALPVYKLSLVVNYFPNYVGMMIFAIKEWCMSKKVTGEDTKHTEEQFNIYVETFKVQHEKLVEKWYETSKAHILGDPAKGIPGSSAIINDGHTSSCLVKIALPDTVDLEGITYEYGDEFNSYPKYLWDVNFTNEFEGPIIDADGIDERYRFFHKIDDQDPDKKFCQFEKIYERDETGREGYCFNDECNRRTNEREEPDFTWNHDERRKYKQIGYKLIPKTCVPSMCQTVYKSMLDEALRALDEAVAAARVQVATTKWMFKDATCLNSITYDEIMNFYSSVELQAVVPKDEIFNGDVCRGKLAIPRSKDLPKKCIVTDIKLAKYGCPVIKNGAKQFILYPDVMRSLVPNLCPNYLRPKRDIAVKERLEAILGEPMSDEEFMQFKLAADAQDDIKNPNGMAERGAEAMVGPAEKPDTSIIQDLSSGDLKE